MFYDVQPHDENFYPRKILKILNKNNKGKIKKNRARNWLEEKCKKKKTKALNYLQI